MGSFTDRVVRPGHAPQGHGVGLAEKIARLRERLVTATQFEEIDDLFHATVVKDDFFIPASTPAMNPKLVSALQTSLSTILPPGAPLSIIMLQVPGFGMWHGMGSWSGGFTIFLYFDEPDMGLICHSSSLHAPFVHYFRFSNLRVEGAVLGFGRRASA